MKRSIRLFAASLFLALVACATVTGTVVGAGIGSIAGDTSTGAIIGGSVGAMVDIID
jgi:hypothetical protein